MAFTKQQIRKMRENSAAGAAKQRAKEQAELDKYMHRRNTEVANTMSTNEKIALVAQGRKDGLSISQIAVKYGIRAGSVSRYVSEAKARGLIPSDCADKPADEQTGGVIDAAELTPDEREKLTVQAERDAGIAPENEPDICDIAKNIMATIRKAMDVPGFDVGLCVHDSGAVEVTVVNVSNRDNNVTLSWR